MGTCTPPRGRPGWAGRKPSWVRLVVVVCVWGYEDRGWPVWGPANRREAGLDGQAGNLHGASGGVCVCGGGGDVCVCVCMCVCGASMGV